MKHNPGFLRLVELAREHVTEQTVSEVKARLDRGEAIHFLDVREDGEFATDHAKGARHLGKGVIERDIETVIPDKEAQIVLGAAVIDDVLGLVVLALVQGIIVSLDAATRGAASSFGVGELGMIVGKAMGFLVGALVLGRLLCRPLFLIGHAARGKGLLVTTALLLCFVLSWLANVAGLAPIVGAFAAGLILDDVHYRELKEKEGVHHLDDLIRPLTDMMVPIFFVVMGMNVDLRSFADLNVLGLAALLTAAAIIGKQACAFGVLDKGTNRLAVGLGMIPRGEVGLIFAAIGLSLKVGSEHVVDSASYSALVVMVMVTTMVTPPLLKWGLSRPTANS